MELALGDRRRKGQIVAVDPETFVIKQTFEYASLAARELGVSKQAINQGIMFGGRVKGFMLFYKKTYEEMIEDQE